MTTSKLDIKYISSNFLNIEALCVKSGEVAFIRGESGSGKSLLLRAIADIDLNKAEILLDRQVREDISAPQWRQQVALLPAQAQWWGEVIGDSLSCSPDELKKLSLNKDILAQPISSISSGENQRLSLLRLLQNKPKVLLLDEPTANLDQISQLNVERYIIAYITKNKASAIWVSHDAEQIKRVSQQLICKTYIMKHGELDE